MATAAGERRSWLLVMALAGAAAWQPLGCTTEGGGATTDARTAEVLAAIGPEVVLPALDAFRAEAVALQGVVAAWDGSEGDGSVQTAFAGAFLAWQPVEMMQLGPAGSSLSVVGGEDLRDTVYAWPAANPCRVDQAIVEQPWTDPGWLDGALVNVQGLDALEHLLFASGEDNACASQATINTDGSWAALTTADRAARRQAYAAALAERLVVLADRLVAAWSPEGGDFSGALATAGSDGSAFATQAAALNAVYDASFYLYKRMTDDKLGTPLGVQGCGSAQCPDAVEARESGLSTGAILANLDGFEAIATGGGTVGLLDLLVDADRTDLADAVRGALADARTALAAVDGPIDAALTVDLADLEAAHAACKALADLWRRDVAPALTLQVPQEAAGDND